MNENKTWCGVSIRWGSQVQWKYVLFLSWEGKLGLVRYLRSFEVVRGRWRLRAFWGKREGACQTNFQQAWKGAPQTTGSRASSSLRWRHNRQLGTEEGLWTRLPPAFLPYPFFFISLLSPLRILTCWQKGCHRGFGSRVIPDSAQSHQLHQLNLLLYEPGGEGNIE